MVDIATKDKKKTQDFVMEKFSPSHIPYACHMDPYTLLTKRGQIVQTIKISGFSQEKAGGVDANIRKTIVDAIKENILTDNYAVWFHTIRKKANIDQSTPFLDELPSAIHNSWCVKNYWHEKYINEIYISIVCSPGNKNFSEAQKMLDSLWFPSLKEDHMQSVLIAKKDLSAVSEKICTALAPHGAKRLSVAIEADAARSQIIDFLYIVLNLSYKPTEMPVQDLADYLAAGKAAFGRNSFEVEADGRKLFGAILSFKEYQDANQFIVEKLLKLPEEYIITQSFTFCAKAVALKSVENLDYMFKVSGDDELRKALKLDEFMNEQGKSTKTLYCEHQTTVTLIADSVSNIENSVKRFTEEAKKSGLLVVREDMLMETLFWSRLPANFNYIKRKNFLPTSQIAGFCSIASAPLGDQESKWGGALTIFRTKDTTPYFFNFHNKNGNGNSLIIGPKDSGKTVLVHFLLYESSRFAPRVFLMGDQKSSITIKSMNGNFYNVAKSVQLFNPLGIPANDASASFLTSWFAAIFNDADKDAIFAMVQRIFALPQEQKNIDNLSLVTDNGAWLEQAKRWQKDGEYAGLFNAGQDIFTFDTEKQIWGFDVSAIKADEDLLLFVSLYLRYIFTSLIQDGAPSIFLINDLTELLRDARFASLLLEDLNLFTSLNAVMLCSVASEDFPSCNFNADIINGFATKILFPNMVNPKEVGNSLHLTEGEVAITQEMKVIYRNFAIFRQDEPDVICELNLDGIDYAIKTLAGFKESVEAMEQAIIEAGNNGDWVEKYYEKINTAQ